VAQLCQRHSLPHLTNNAYGLQSSKCLHLVEEAAKNSGQYDIFVQSADKNLMVPVGGAIVAGFNRQWVQNIAKTYPGMKRNLRLEDLFYLKEVHSLFGKIL